MFSLTQSNLPSYVSSMYASPDTCITPHLKENHTFTSHLHTAGAYQEVELWHQEKYRAKQMHVFIISFGFSQHVFINHLDFQIKF